MFETNQRKFYEELDVKETSSEEELDSEKAKQFWNKLWSQDVKDNKSTEWFARPERRENTHKQEDLTTNEHKVKHLEQVFCMAQEL